MVFLFIIVISIVQGITEFLPVSSSGHLILVYKLFNINGETQLLSIILHLATLISIIVYYRKDILKLIKNPLCKTNKLLVVATIPTVVFVLIFKSFVDASFSGSYLIFGFLITALFLGIADFLTESDNKMSKSSKYITETSLLTNINNDNNIKSRQTNIQYEKLKDEQIQPSRHNISANNSQNTHDICNINIAYWKSIVLGVVQGFACLPAISRSGSTISAGLIMKIDKETITKFSFLMSIPIIIASLVYEIIFPPSANLSLSAVFVIIAFIITSIVGYFSIKLMTKLVNKSKLSYFSYYLIALVFVMLITKLVFRFA